MDRKVVVTGLGVVSSIGIGKDDFWKNLIQGKSGISEVTLFDTSNFNRHNAGEIKNFNPKDFIPKEIIPYLGRATQFAISATKLALDDAKISINNLKNNACSIIIGTTLTEANALDFSSDIFLKEHWDELNLKLLFNTFSPSISRNIGHILDLKGINLLTPNACAAGNYAIAHGYDLIRRGEIDNAIVGGTEALSRIAYQGFQRLYAMAPEKCSPFDKNRKGMLLGEGSGILILENMDNAKKRNAPIYAEILGYGLSCDAYHMTIPKKEGIKKSMDKALRNSNINLNDIDYICAHGTGTQANDKEESGAIKDIFNNKRVPVSSIKSMLGHSLGAASGIEALTCCLAIKNGTIPPTINFETSDPECDIDCVPNDARQKKINIVLNNGFAFGGNNCCITMGNYKQ